MTHFGKLRLFSHSILLAAIQIALLPGPVLASDAFEVGDGCSVTYSERVQPKTNANAIYRDDKLVSASMNCTLAGQAPELGLLRRRDISATKVLVFTEQCEVQAEGEFVLSPCSKLSSSGEVINLLDTVVVMYTQRANALADDAVLSDKYSALTFGVRVNEFERIVSLINEILNSSKPNSMKYGDYRTDDYYAEAVGAFRDDISSASLRSIVFNDYSFPSYSGYFSVEFVGSKKTWEMILDLTESQIVLKMLEYERASAHN